MLYQKKESPPSLIEFSRILDGPSHDNTLGHLFIVDITFNNINPKTLLFNELYPPIFEKNKKMELLERSTIQLLIIMVRSEDKEKINCFLYSSKTHSTLKAKKYINFYAEDLHFLITGAGWLVTHIYKHYTFEQSKFKKDFVVMNQKARQKATSSVERYFYMLLNNSNFDIHCRNNIDNCLLTPLYDDTNISAKKKAFCTLILRTFCNQKYSK